MNNASEFSKRFAQYSAIAASIFSTGTAQSQIIYNDLNPDVVIGDNGIQNYYLDLNNDGDFEFYLFADSGLGIYKYYPYNNDKILVNHEGGYEHLLKQLNYGNIISTNLFDWDAVGYAYYNGNLYWDGQEKYVAFRIKENNEFLFGWMRLQVTIDPGNTSMVLKDYAFNNTAGAPIASGATAASSCDLYEPNDKFSEATVINPNSTIPSLINPAGDKDFFKFTTTNSKSNVRVILYDLPKNYDLVLYNELKEKLDVSKRTHKSNDTVAFNNSDAGTYYVKVFQKDGNFDPSNCYSLRVETSSTPFRISALIEDELALFVYPNPASQFLTVTIDEELHTEIPIFIFDLEGREVLSAILPEGINYHQLDISSLHSGMYLLKAIVESEVVIKKITVE